MKALTLVAIGPSLALLALYGCAARRIPGTQIEDTEEARAIVDLMEQYRRAVEARDAPKVIALVADSFKDTAGTPSPEDDLDYAKLREELPRNLAKLDEVRLDLNVRKIEVTKEAARAVYTYTASWKMPSLTGRPQSDSDIKEMWFKRIDGEWKITSGI